MEFVVGRAKFERAKIALAVALVAAPCGVVQAQARADSALPGANPIDEMSRQQRPQSGGSLPIRMGDKAELALGETSVNGRYDGDTVMFQGSVGLGINSTTGSGQRNPTVQAGGSVLVDRDSALGLNVNLSSQYKEGVLAGVTQLRDRPWRLKGAVSYAQGRQYFDFFSGGDWAPLSQWGYFASAQYIEPTDASLGLHSAGISAWGAAASNRGPGLAPVTSVIEAPEEWRIVTDRKLVSAGHTQGVALDAQFALHSDLVLHGSLGLSQVKYPFSDGTSQRDFAPYVAAGLRYEAWPALLLIAGYKQDVIQRRLELGVEYKGLRLSAYSAKGINGVPGDQGVMLTADLLALTRPSGLSRGSLAERVKLRSGQDVGRQVLVDAMARPVQLPQTFVAKVDPTAVTQIDINKSGLPQGATVDPKTGDITFQVGSAGLSVSDITRQVAGASGGGPFTNAGQFSINGNSVTVHVRHLPVPASVDSYVISLIDGTGVQYRAKVSGQRGAV